MRIGTVLPAIGTIFAVIVFVAVNAVATSACACISIADNQNSAKREIEVFIALIKEYQTSNQMLPVTLTEVLEYQKQSNVLSRRAIPQDTLDPWGTEYLYKQKAKILGPDVSIKSLGNDMTIGGWFENRDISN